MKVRMVKMGKKVKQRSWEEVNASIRRDWGEVKPYTRVHDSKKNKKPKHKKREEERDME